MVKLYEGIRGFGHVKEAGYQAAQTKLAALRKAFDTPPAHKGAAA
jgi:indolepyruvate ferredoxin oxidoreductase